MKINSIISHSLVQNYERVSRVTGDKSDYQVKTDSVELSDSALAFANAVGEAKKSGGAASAERAARVAELKSQVNDGTYHVDGELIASSMLSGILFDSRA